MSPLLGGDLTVEDQQILLLLDSHRTGFDKVPRTVYPLQLEKGVGGGAREVDRDLIVVAALADRGVVLDKGQLTRIVAFGRRPAVAGP